MNALRNGFGYVCVTVQTGFQPFLNDEFCYENTQSGNLRLPGSMAKQQKNPVEVPNSQAHRNEVNIATPNFFCKTLMIMSNTDGKNQF